MFLCAPFFVLPNRRSTAVPFHFFFMPRLYTQSKKATLHWIIRLKLNWIDLSKDNLSDFHVYMLRTRWKGEKKERKRERGGSKRRIQFFIHTVWMLRWKLRRLIELEGIGSYNSLEESPFRPFLHSLQPVLLFFHHLVCSVVCLNNDETARKQFNNNKNITCGKNMKY